MPPASMALERKMKHRENICHSNQTFSTLEKGLSAQQQEAPGQRVGTRAGMIIGTQTKENKGETKQLHCNKDQNKTGQLYYLSSTFVSHPSSKDFGSGDQILYSPFYPHDSCPVGLVWMTVW